MSFTIKTELINNKTKVFRSAGKAHWNVRVFLDNTNQEASKEIKQVDYELHPTFKNRLRTAYSSSNNFEIAIWTYGFFEVKVKIYFTDGTTEELFSYIKWT